MEYLVAPDIRGATALVSKWDMGSAPLEVYTVDLRRGSCSCPAWLYRKGVCKHIRMARVSRALQINLFEEKGV